MITILLNSLLALFSQADHSYTGSSPARPVAPFNKIVNASLFKVVVVTGAAESVQLEGIENIAPEDIITVVKNKELKISLKDGNYKNLRGEVRVTCRHLDQLTNTGPGTITSAADLVADKFTVEAASSGKIQLNLQVQQLKIVGSGASQLEISGKATHQYVHLTGSAHLNSVNLLSQVCDVQVKGPGNASVNVARELSVSISGAGRVNYTGNAQVNSKTVGKETVHKLI